MAANVLTIGSKFNPLSFDEMAKPLIMYKQEADKLEEEINKYEEQGDVIGSLINPTSDIEANKLYTTFKNNAISATNDFYNNGLNSNTRKNLLNLKRNYAENMTKIQAAYSAREAERKLQTEMRAKDPTMMFSRDANYESLDSYLTGKQPTSIPVSGDYLYQQGLRAGAAASSRQDISVEAKKALGNTYWQLKTEQRFTDTEALNYMEKDPMFGTIISTIKAGSNIDKLSPADQEIASKSIINGFLTGMTGKQDIDFKPVVNVKVNTGTTGKTGSGDFNRFERVSLPSDVNDASTRELKGKISDVEFAQTLEDVNGIIESPETILQKKENAEEIERLRKIEEEWGGIPTLASNDPKWNRSDSPAKLLDSNGNEIPLEDIMGEKFTELSDYGKKVMIGNKTKELLKAAQEYDRLNKKIKTFTKESKRIEELQDKYGNLIPDDPIKGIKIGTQIAQNQSILDNDVITFNTTSESERNNILSNLTNKLRLLTDNDVSIDKATGGIFKYNSKNGKYEPITEDDYNTYLADKDGNIDLSNFTLGFNFKALRNGNGIILTKNDGKENVSFTWKGTNESNFSRELEISDKFTRSFDNDTKPININDLSNEDLVSVLRSGIPESIKSTGKSLGNGLYGYTLRTNDNDIIKVVYKQSTNKIIKMSSMYAEASRQAHSSRLRSSTLMMSALNLLESVTGSISKQK